MSYLSWFENHGKKHKEIVEKVTEGKLIEYFRWENISKTDVDFCFLFAQNKKCHDISIVNLLLNDT